MRDPLMLDGTSEIKNETQPLILSSTWVDKIKIFKGDHKNLQVLILPPKKVAMKKLCS